MANLRNQVEFAATLTRELPNLSMSGVLELCRFLVRAEATLHRLSETAGNRELTLPELRREARLMTRVREAGARHGLGVTFNSDPRGAAIYLRLPSGRSNDWGGRGWAVP